MVGRGDHRCGACAGVLETGLRSPWAVGGGGRRSAGLGHGAGYFDAIDWYASNRE
jgi:hypothetical protein